MHAVVSTEVVNMRQITRTKHARSANINKLDVAVPVRLTDTAIKHIKSKHDSRAESINSGGIDTSKLTPGATLQSAVVTKTEHIMIAATQVNAASIKELNTAVRLYGIAW